MTIYDDADIPLELKQYFRSAELGGEDTLDEYIENLVRVFREVKRVLHPKGTLWLNLGDCHAGGGRHSEQTKYAEADAEKPIRRKQKKLSGKDLLMVPARAALALQADGWILRSDIIWAKALSFLPAFSGSVMPESTRDRPTHAHEHLFLLALSEDYFYDQDAFREAFANSTKGNYQLRIEEKDVKGTLKRVYKIRRMSNVAYSKASWIDVDVTSVMSG